MYLHDVTLPTLSENLALDEAFLLQAEAGGPELLRLWEWTHPAVVLGAGGRITDDVEEAACLADGVPISRRSSGGGTVLLGRGCLLYSLILRYDREPPLSDLHASYRYIFAQILHALSSVGSPLAQRGSSDLTLGERKFSGNSQQRKRTHFLHHGTLLHDFDLGCVSRYLKEPPRRPEYREHRSHADFLTNLPASGADLRQLLRGAWQAEERLEEWPADLVKQLVQEKYGREDWVRRR